MLVVDHAVDAHGRRCNRGDRHGHRPRDETPPAKNVGDRYRQRRRAGGVAARITIRASPHTAATRAFAHIDELERAMYEPSQPRGRDDRRAPTLSASVEYTRHRIRHRDVTARQAEREKRPQDLANDAHWPRSRHTPRPAIDQWRVAIAQPVRQEHHRDDRCRADRELRRGLAGRPMTCGSL
jgi:hypothetical protein